MTEQAMAIFGAGCFWGVEAAFREVKGVSEVISGYSGGHFKNPSYHDVCTGKTGHAEVVRVEYDPSQVDYEALLDVFWDCHNPTTRNRQGPDVGTQYRSAIFFYTPEQEAAAKASKKKLEQSGRWREPIVTEISPATEFYPAEEYHQRYLEKRGISGHCRP
jgi:peptide-methionine (S)-S-oxide reductase